MKIKKITKQQMFDLIGEKLTDTNKIKWLSIHLPDDPKTHDYIFNYEVVEPEIETVPLEVIP